MEKLSLNNRLKLLRAHLGFSQTDLAQEIGFSQSYYSEIENEKVPPNERFFKLIEQTFHVNPKWLREGEGEMFTEEARKQVESKFSIHREIELVPWSFKGVWDPNKRYDKDDYVLFPVYNEVDAGNAERNHNSVEPIDYVPVKVEWIKDNVLGIKVIGDSMIPTVSDGSVVLVDTNQKRIIDGKLFAIEIPHIGATVKRVFVEYNKLILKADNPVYKEKEYPLDVIEKEELRIVGRITKVVEIKNV
jgi:phage repressor protein C with HTH and peptisase S24 domain